MAKEKACRHCKNVYEGAKCSKCGSDDFSDTFKGKVLILDPEQSEIAKNIKLKEKGVYAARL